MFSWSEKNYETLNSKHKNSKLGKRQNDIFLKWPFSPKSSHVGKQFWFTILVYNSDPWLKSFLVDLLLENDIAAVDQFKVNGKVDQIPVKKAPGRPRKAVAEHSNGFPCKVKSDIFCLVC